MLLLIQHHHLRLGAPPDLHATNGATNETAHRYLLTAT
jgi:hypothetical protein